MAYTLANLQDDIRNYTEVSSTVLTDAILERIIKNAEHTIFRAVDVDNERFYATSTTIINKRYVSIPADCRVIRYVQLKNGSNVFHFSKGEVLQASKWGRFFRRIIKTRYNVGKPPEARFARFVRLRLSPGGGRGRGVITTPLCKLLMRLAPAWSAAASQASAPMCRATASAASAAEPKVPRYRGSAVPRGPVLADAANVPFLVSHTPLKPLRFDGSSTNVKPSARASRSASASAIGVGRGGGGGNVARWRAYARAASIAEPNGPSMVTLPDAYACARQRLPCFVTPLKPDSAFEGSSARPSSAAICLT